MRGERGSGDVVVSTPDATEVGATGSTVTNTGDKKVVRGVSS